MKPHVSPVVEWFTECVWFASCQSTFRIIYLHSIHGEQRQLVFATQCISESIHFSTLDLWLTACNCNTFGSYSSQCNYTTGDCHCRPNIRGSHCDRCDEGMVGFPTCVKCDCNPIGSRFLPGLANNVCYGSAKVSVMRVDRLVQSDRPFLVAFLPPSHCGKPFIWKSVQPTGSFSCKWNFFSYKRFCTMTRFWNLGTR